MSECRIELANAGKPSPRTCRSCKLGPCKRRLDPTGPGIDLIDQQAVEVPRSAFRVELDKMLARDKRGAVADMVDALVEAGAMKRLAADLEMDSRELERHGSDYRVYVRRNVAAGMIEELEQSGAIVFTEEPNRLPWLPIKVHARLEVLKP